MIKHRYGGCATCHADPSGGELLTLYGRAQGDLLLRFRYSADQLSGQASDPGESDDFRTFDTFDEDLPETEGAEGEAGTGVEGAKRGKVHESEQRSVTEEEDESSDAARFLWGLVELPQSLLLGGAYRHMFLYEPEAGLELFPMQIDLWGRVAFGDLLVAASLGISKVPFGSPHARAAQLTAGQGDTINVISRTHWVGYNLSESVMVRAGRLNLPFGVRIPEHTMWVREATRTDRDSDQQHGLAIAFSRLRSRGEAMLILGNYQIGPDRFRERGYSLYIEGMISDSSAFGASSLFTRAEQDAITLDEEPMVRHAHGIFTRLTVLDPMVLLGEFNLLMHSRRDTGYVGFAQLDYEIQQGLHFLLTGEVLDSGFQTGAIEGRPEQRRAGLGLPRWGGWVSVDWFFLPHLEARVDLVIRQTSPEQLLAQLHLYL
jgi:hypothetical protein